MYVFTSIITIPSGVTLAGNGIKNIIPTSELGYLEVNGIGNIENDIWELCSIDALYAGNLAAAFPESDNKIFMASHTHYAPMLDSKKVELGYYNEEMVLLFKKSITNSNIISVAPKKCTIFIQEIDIPVYRRFDYPKSIVNKLLTKYAGLFPNEGFKIDRNVYIFLFSEDEKNLFAFVYHACHPVSRSNINKTSADYIDIIRESVRERFNVQTCLFMQGCSGDIRPNIAEKRIVWLPRSRFNWKFKYPVTIKDEYMVDQKYQHAIVNAKEIKSFQLNDNSFRKSIKKINIDGYGELLINMITINNTIHFYFLPFEISHLYHLEVMDYNKSPYKFLVSCSNDTMGYLPHPTQVSNGGYEVDGSRNFMRINNRISLKGGDFEQ